MEEEKAEQANTETNKPSAEKVFSLDKSIVQRQGGNDCLVSLAALLELFHV